MALRLVLATALLLPRLQVAPVIPQRRSNVQKPKLMQENLRKAMKLRALKIVPVAKTLLPRLKLKMKKVSLSLEVSFLKEK